MPTSVMKQTARVFHSLAGIDLAAMDAEIDRQKGEIMKLIQTRDLIAKIRESVGSNEANPTQPVRGMILDQVSAFLRDGKEATTLEIAAAIGYERVQAYQAMRKHPERFRQRKKHWSLKS